MPERSTTLRGDSHQRGSRRRPHFRSRVRRRLGDGRTTAARRLLIATGLSDELQVVEGLRERWGRDVLHCPYCHGWEVRHRAIGVLASGPTAVHQALLFRQWSANITLFLNDAIEPSEEEWEQLSAHPLGIGKRVETSAQGVTSVAGVWVAGNVSDLTAQVMLPLPPGWQQPRPSMPISSAKTPGGRSRSRVN